MTETSQMVLEWASNIGLVMFSVAFFLTCYRIVVGPTLPDRILSLDLLTASAIGFICIFAIKTDRYVYLDVAISLGLVGFLATVAFARFILQSKEINIKDHYEDRPDNIGEKG
jgi:multicomponent Na+:H+ antiporter subunit F